MLKQAWVPNINDCPMCGHPIHVSADLCPECGFQPNPVRSAASGLSTRRLLVILLAFFLGSFGAHKFYLKRPVQGILYLLFSWTFIPALVGIIESIYYITLNNEAFESKYNKALR